MGDNDTLDLFGDAARKRLLAAGWQPAGKIQGLPAWRDPDTQAVLIQDEALRRLERQAQVKEFWQGRPDEDIASGGQR